MRDDNLPVVPYPTISRDKRAGFWRVMQDLVRSQRVAPRDRDPELYDLKYYKVAVSLGWAVQAEGAEHLTYEVTDNGVSEFKRSFGV